MKILIVILILFFIVVIMFHFFGKNEGFWSINSNRRKQVPPKLENYKMITVPNSSVYKEDVSLFGLACADRLLSSDVYNTMVITNGDSSNPYSCYVGNYVEPAKSTSTPKPLTTRPPIPSKKRPPILRPRKKKRSPAPQTAAQPVPQPAPQRAAQPAPQTEPPVSVSILNLNGTSSGELITDKKKLSNADVYYLEDNKLLYVTKSCYVKFNVDVTNVSYILIGKGGDGGAGNETGAGGGGGAGTAIIGDIDNINKGEEIKLSFDDGNVSMMIKDNSPINVLKGGNGGNGGNPSPATLGNMGGGGGGGDGVGSCSSNGVINSINQKRFPGRGGKAGGGGGGEGAWKPLDYVDRTNTKRSAAEISICVSGQAVNGSEGGDGIEWGDKTYGKGGGGGASSKGDGGYGGSGWNAAGAGRGGGIGFVDGISKWVQNGTSGKKEYDRNIPGIIDGGWGNGGGGGAMSKNGTPGMGGEGAPGIFIISFTPK